MRARLATIITEALYGAGELIWPRTCHVCGCALPAHARYLCSACLTGIPRLPQSENGISEGTASALEARLSGYASPLRATAWMAYSRHSPYAGLLHDIKYRGCSRLARHLGHLMAMDLLPTGFFNGVDALVPVPLPLARRLRRGYNQSEMLARGVAEVLNVPTMDALRALPHRTQTRLSHDQRRKNVQGVYRPHGSHPLFTSVPATWRHVVVIDDVCTTGATLSQAILALRQSRPDLQVSALALALADKA